MMLDTVYNIKDVKDIKKGKINKITNRSKEKWLVTKGRKLYKTALLESDLITSQNSTIRFFFGCPMSDVSRLLESGDFSKQERHFYNISSFKEFCSNYALTATILGVKLSDLAPVAESSDQGRVIIQDFLLGGGIKADYAEIFFRSFFPKECDTFYSIDYSIFGISVDTRTLLYNGKKARFMARSMPADDIAKLFIQRVMYRAHCIGCDTIEAFLCDNSLVRGCLSFTKHVSRICAVSSHKSHLPTPEMDMVRKQHQAMVRKLQCLISSPLDIVQLSV